MFALKPEQRGAPAVVEAVRHRCSHIAATKAERVFDVICSQARLRDVHFPCGCLICAAIDARKLLLTQSFTCIAAMSCRISSKTICGVTNTGGGGGGAKQPGRGLEQCPSTAGLAAIAGTRPSQVPSPYQVFICLFNLKKLEKVMLHKGDNPRLAASQTQVNAIGASKHQ